MLRALQEKTALGYCNSGPAVDVAKQRHYRLWRATSMISMGLVPVRNRNLDTWPMVTHRTRIRPVEHARAIWGEFNQRAKLRPHVFLCLAYRRIIVHRENRHRALTSCVQNVGLTGEVAVAVDADVATRADDIGVVKETCGSIMDRDIVDGITGHASLDEWRINAGVVDEGSDQRRIYRETVA